MAEYKCVTDINELKKYVKGAKIVAFDFETSPDDGYRNKPRAALDPHFSDIVGCSFSVEPGTAVYVPIAHKSGENMDKAEFFSFLAWLLENKDITKIAHNIAFEAKFAYKHGIVIQPPVYDTICASQMTLKDEYNFKTLHESGLKTLVPEVLGIQLPTFSDVTEGRHFDELDAQDAETVRYGCADSDYALILYNAFNSWFDDFLKPHRFVVENIESPAAVYIGLMAYNGVLVNKDTMLKARERLTAIKEEDKNKILSITGDINIGSNCSTKAFKDFLYKEHNLPLQYRRDTKTNEERITIDDMAMQDLKEYCEENEPSLAPLFDYVQHYRKMGKLISTYIDGYEKFINSYTGCIHADFFNLSTDTGRMSCNSPNLQNMPRKSNDEAGVRSFFIAPEGCLILSLDFSQIELRVGAFFCRDEKMMETYRTGGDIHATTMHVIFGDEDGNSDKSKHGSEHRTIAKNVNFGTFYGLYPRGLQSTLKYKAHINRTIEECAEIIDNIKRGYPRLVQWQDDAKLKARNNGYAETEMGRRRYLPDINSMDWAKRSFAERCALNTPIQGTAADILKLACTRIIEGLPEHDYIKPILQIHDELVFYVPEDKLTEAVSFIKDCMETKPFDKFDIPLVAEAESGPNFADLESVD